MIEEFRRHYRALFENSTDGVLLVESVSGQIIEANVQVGNLLGIAYNELIGADIMKVGIFADEDSSRSALQRLAVDSETYLQSELVQVRGQAAIPIEIKAHGVTAGRGRLIHLSIRDMTNTRKLEQAVKLQMDRLEWSNRELQSFAHIASHDLQEPLRAIQAFGDRLAEKYADVLDETGRDYLRRMQDSATRMRVLVHDLAAYARVNSGIRPEGSVSLNWTAASVISDLSSSIEEAGATIVVDELPDIKGNAAQCRQLLQNLIANAIKFRKLDVAPIIKIYIGAGSANTGSDANSFVEVVVEDNGIGFDQKYADRVFAPFQRLHSRRQYSGTGIGLAVCRKIVEMASGKIRAISELGVGTKIAFTLPLAVPEVN